MSHSTIKNNINRLLKERDWKVAHLEKKLGSTRAVTNILRGSSKNPCAIEKQGGSNKSL